MQFSGGDGPVDVRIMRLCWDGVAKLVAIDDSGKNRSGSQCAGGNSGCYGGHSNRHHAPSGFHLVPHW